MDSLCLGIKSNKLDGVISFAVMQYVNNYEKFLSEIAGIVKKGGVVLISIPNKIKNPDYSKLDEKIKILFTPNEFEAQLRNHFSSVKIYGEQLAEELVKSQKTLQFLSSLDILNLKKIIPPTLKIKIHNFSNLFIGGKNISEIDEKCVKYTKYNLLEANDLIAVCLK